MTQIELGSLRSDNHRDAIHVAVVPLVLKEPMTPGEWFQLDDDGEAIGGSEIEAIGIIDPFLSRRSYSAGCEVWGVLRPNTISGMRHHWYHPAFDRR